MAAVAVAAGEASVAAAVTAEILQPHAARAPSRIQIIASNFAVDCAISRPIIGDRKRFEVLMRSQRGEAAGVSRRGPRRCSSPLPSRDSCSGPRATLFSLSGRRRSRGKGRRTDERAQGGKLPHTEVSPGDPPVTYNGSASFSRAARSRLPTSTRDERHQ